MPASSRSTTCAWPARSAPTSIRSTPWCSAWCTDAPVAAVRRSAMLAGAVRQGTAVDVGPYRAGGGGEGRRKDRDGDRTEFQALFVAAMAFPHATRAIAPSRRSGRPPRTNFISRRARGPSMPQTGEQATTSTIPAPMTTKRALAGAAEDAPGVRHSAPRMSSRPRRT